MANDNHANYAKVGFVVVAGVAAIVAALVWFGGVGGAKNEFFAETYYRAPVSGLSVGSEVNFRGVKVGEVREISFIGAKYDAYARDDMQTVYVKMAFDPRLARMDPGASPEEFLESLVARGLRATVRASGITGLAALELNLPRGEAVPVAPPSWKPDLVCIPPAPSMLQNFSDAATLVMNRMKKIDFVAAWSNVATVAESASRIAQNVDGLVESQKARLDSILSTADETARAFKEFADTIRDNPSLLLRTRDDAPLPETQN